MSSDSTQSTVAGEFLATLYQRGIRYVMANGGTDFAPLIEELARRGTDTAEVPRFLTIPHENVAVAMAHGFAMVSGQPAAAMVHVNVGTANAIMGIMNAARDNIPLLLMAGRTPLTYRDQVGSRSGHIHWGQENFDQAAMLREYVKWDYELRHGQPISDLIHRALDVAQAEPSGPVYLTLPREVFAESVEALKEPLFTSTQAKPQPDLSALMQLQKRILQASHPVILTSHSGRNPQAVSALAEVSAKYAIPVLQPFGRFMNLPSSHAMNFGSAYPELMKTADLFILVDCEVPWIPHRFEPSATVPVIHLGVDPLYVRYPYRQFRNDQVIPGDLVSALSELTQRIDPNPNPGVEERRQRLVMQREKMWLKKRAEIDSLSQNSPISVKWLAECINRVKAPNAIVINELGVPFDYLEMEQPGTYFGNNTAGGLGWGLGASLGARLAQPDRQIITILGDGCYMFGNPTPFHFVARANQLPTLTIIQNNHRWHAVEASTRVVYPDGVASTMEVMPIADLSPSPDFCKVAEASGAWAKPVHDPSELEAAIAEALNIVAGGRQALLDVNTQPGGFR